MKTMTRIASVLAIVCALLFAGCASTQTKTNRMSAQQIVDTTVTVDSGCAGVVVRKDNKGNVLVLTAAHCVRGFIVTAIGKPTILNDIGISVRHGKNMGKCAAKVKAFTDSPSDLALLEAQGCGLAVSVASISSKTPAVGDKMSLVGSPGGYYHTFTTGVVSYLDRISRTTGGKYTQVSAMSTPGASGGPAFDSSGKVIGILSRGAGSPVAIGNLGIIGVAHISHITMLVPLDEIRKFLEFTGNKDLLR